MKKERTSKSYEPPASKHPFSLELVASIAVHILLAGGRDFKEKLYYDGAADVAVELLHACQERLENDEVIEAQVQALKKLTEPFLQAARKEAELKLKHGDRINFLAGLLHITGKASETVALPFYKRWLRYKMEVNYAEAERRNFFGTGEPTRPNDENVELALVVRHG